MKFVCLAVLVSMFVTVNVVAQQNFKADLLSKHVYQLASDEWEGRSVGAKGGDKAAEYIANEFKNIGIKPFLSNYYHHFAFRTQSTITSEAKNVIGVIEGSDPNLKNEYIVIGGHYDHVGYYYGKKSKTKVIYNGADDNASGVAGIIELGRAIMQHKDQFSRSIILVAFDGEESGLNGSKWMVYDSIIEPKQIKLMFSLDMIGMLNKAEGLELLGAGTLKNGKIIARQIAEKSDIEIKKATKALQNRTDTKPFGDLGIPSIHITTGTVSPYHKPEDDANLLDYDGMAKIMEFVYAWVFDAANSDYDKLLSNLTNSKGEVNSKFFKPGVKIGTGSSWHNYPDLPYRGKNSFAAQAGVYAHIDLFSRFALQPEVLYETLASDHANGTIRTHAITTPVNILIGFAGNRDFDTWTHFMLGGYYTYNFGGKNGTSELDFTNTFEEIEYGINFGYAINISKVQIAVTRKYALSNLNKDPSMDNIQNNAFFFSMGLQF